MLTSNTKYYLHVKDVMRDYIFVVDYSSLKELKEAYKRYNEDTDYEVVSMHYTKIETNVINIEELNKIAIEENNDLRVKDVLKKFKNKHKMVDICHPVLSRIMGTIQELSTDDSIMDMKISDWRINNTDVIEIDI